MAPRFWKYTNVAQHCGEFGIQEIRYQSEEYGPKMHFLDQYQCDV